ncbi:MAG: CSLREA domain-containing protein [Acidobacteriota bacterium]
MTARRTQLRSWAIALAALTGLTIGMARPVHPAEFVVNSIDDHMDGTCDGADCSLRDAVWVANLDPGADLISLPAGNFVLDIPGPDEDDCLTGDIDILSAMIIVGMGADATIIDAGSLGDRVLHVNASGESVGLANLTVTGGV